jgi:Xaa-Pro dipeptidase
MRLLEFRYVKSGAPEADYPDASDVLGSLRLRKDKEEIEAMRQAVKVAPERARSNHSIDQNRHDRKGAGSGTGHAVIEAWLGTGTALLPDRLRRTELGQPHASPTERKLQAGDLLVIDWGATVDGYISDLTRTFAVGQVDAEYEKIHKIVQEANAAGRAAGKPGVPARMWTKPRAL